MSPEIHPGAPTVYLELWEYPQNLWLRIICWGPVLKIPHSANLSSNLWSLTIHSCLLSHQENVAVENIQGFATGLNPASHATRCWNPSGCPGSPSCLQSSQFHFDFKSIPQMHPDPWAIHLGKVLELEWIGSYLESLLNMHLFHSHRSWLMKTGMRWGKIWILTNSSGN